MSTRNLIPVIGKWSLLVAFGTVLAGCGARAKLIKRYHAMVDMTIENTEMQNYIDVSGNVQNQPPTLTPNRSFFDLSPQGQKALIKALSTKETKSDDFLAKLTTKLNLPDEKKNIIDNTVFTKRIVIATKNLSHNPADRITSLTVHLSFSDANIQVLSCDKVISQFGSYDAGTASFSRSSNLSVAASLGGSFQKNGSAGTANADSASANNYTTKSTGSGTQANLSSTVTGSASNTTTYNEQVNQTLRYVAISASVHDNVIDVFQQSVSGVDLTGNVFIDISFRYKKPDVKVFYDFSGLSKPAVAPAIAPVIARPQEIGIAEDYLFYPNTNDDLSISCTYEPVIRHVIKGDATITEADDDVEQLNAKTTISTTKNLTIPKLEFNPVLWDIRLPGVPLKLVYIQSPIRSGPEPLVFTSFEKAKAFLIWLKQTQANVTAASIFSPDGYLLQINGAALMPADIKQLHIETL